MWTKFHFERFPSEPRLKISNLLFHWHIFSCSNSRESDWDLQQSLSLTPLPLCSLHFHISVLGSISLSHTHHSPYSDTIISHLSPLNFASPQQGTPHWLCLTLFPIPHLFSFFSLCSFLPPVRLSLPSEQLRPRPSRHRIPSNIYAPRTGPIAQTLALLSAVLLRCMCVYYLYIHRFGVSAGSPTCFSTLAVKLFGILSSLPKTSWQLCQAHGVSTTTFTHMHTQRRTPHSPGEALRSSGSSRSDHLKLKTEKKEDEL